MQAVWVVAGAAIVVAAAVAWRLAGEVPSPEAAVHRQRRPDGNLAFVVNFPGLVQDVVSSCPCLVIEAVVPGADWTVVRGVVRCEQQPASVVPGLLVSSLTREPPTFVAVSCREDE